MERRKFRIDGTLVVAFENISDQFSFMHLFLSHKRWSVCDNLGREIIDMRSQTTTAFSELMLWPLPFTQSPLLKLFHLLACQYCSNHIYYFYTTNIGHPRNLLIHLHKCFFLPCFVDRMKWRLYFNILLFCARDVGGRITFFT